MKKFTLLKYEIVLNNPIFKYYPSSLFWSLLLYNLIATNGTIRYQ
jgi:hypothetical protein